MGREDASKATIYRDKGMTLRQLAAEVRSAEGRARLLALAESFEKLADRVEAWERMPAAAD